VCGRIVLKADPGQIAAEFAVPEPPALAPRYNIAPSQPVVAVRSLADSSRRADLLQWGLIPPWAPDRSLGAKLFNARSETVTAKPAFREAFARRRCLIPVDGFYEWRRDGRTRRPFYFSAAGARLLALAGLWERWEYPGRVVIESCSILTTEANRLLRPVHRRMPVILAPEHHESWLTTPAEHAHSLQALLVPAGEDVLRAWPVSPAVSRTSAEGPELIAPEHDDPPGQLPLF